MQQDITDAKFNPSTKNEPETRVKQTVHKSVVGKFRDVLKHTQQLQQDYKTAVQERIKRELKIANDNATEEELDEWARDPAKAKEILS